MTEHDKREQARTDISDSETPFVTLLSATADTPASMGFHELTEQYQWTKDQDMNARVDLRFPLAGGRSELQLGARYRDKTKHYLHPIIDWWTGDVWAYIRTHKLSYCSLYDEGWDRLGCILCPMTRKVEEQMERWPKIAALWERTIKSVWKPDKGKVHKFPSADALWRWWLDRDAKITDYTKPVKTDGRFV